MSIIYNQNYTPNMVHVHTPTHVHVSYARADENRNSWPITDQVDTFLYMLIHHLMFVVSYSMVQ